jgi:hypothetical protein
MVMILKTEWNCPMHFARRQFEKSELLNIKLIDVWIQVEALKRFAQRPPRMRPPSRRGYGATSRRGKKEVFKRTESGF